MAVRKEGKNAVFSMIQVLHELNGDVGFLPRTTEYITFIVEKGSSFFVTVGYFRGGRRKCLAKV
ncbi:hypothetical protein AOA59_18195 [Pseudomonas sp. 2822-15]|nr:hypothetical protein AOA59_18195 [Pseudomonas sp. 2822-15]